MTHDGAPWVLIIMMFAYAFVGWTAMFAVHCHIKRRRTNAPTARHAAIGYGESWKTSRASELQ